MSALNNTSYAQNEQTHALQKYTVRYRNFTLVCIANVAETSKPVALFPFRSRNLDSSEVYKY